MKKIAALSLFFLLLSVFHEGRCAVRNTVPSIHHSPFTIHHSKDSADMWVEKKMHHLSLKEKVGQLMFVRVPQTMNKKEQKAFEHTIKHHRVGGVCFFKGTAAEQLRRTKHYQHLAHIPLMVTIDAEWGLGMRLTDCYEFPRQMLMGALSTKNDTLIALFGEEVGRQCRKMGIHVNFAPVCDINNNPANPVIGCRSFGENKKRVARKSLFYARAMQRMGVMAVGKHFPGHGDTDKDSHIDLPVIKHSLAYIDSVDLFPFRHLVNNGIRGIMVAHLQVNALDSRPNMPSSLSERIVSPILRKQMGFDGLVFTDGIDMKAVSKNYKDGEGAIRAVRAGCDVILLPIDVEKTIDALVAEAKRDTAFESMIDDRCRRILREKYVSGLAHINVSKYAVPTREDYRRCSELTSRIAEKALTLVRNNNYTLPLDRLKPPVSIAFGKDDTAVTVLDSALMERIHKNGTVVMSLYGNLSPSGNYGVPQGTIDIINRIGDMEGVNSVLVIYGSPYILESFPQPLPTNKSATENAFNAIQNARSAYPKGPSAIIVAYQNMPEVRDVVPSFIYGDKAFEGKLPVTAGNYREGTSLKLQKKPEITRYDDVRRAGMDEKCFVKIDSICNAGIKAQAYPGCQLLVAKDGKVVYSQCYGHQTYDPASPLVDSLTVYDLASLTKVCATNLAVMKLVDAGKINLDDRLSRYLPYLKHTNKSKITVRQALSHYARLKAFDAYWKEALNDGSLKNKNENESFIPIGDGVYIKNSYREKMLKQIAKSPLEKQQKYLYSDLGFILLADMVQQVSGQSIDIFMQQHFYKPLGMKSTFYQPLQHDIVLQRIAPTETDKSFRNQLLRGYVHDPNAAAMGGVAGHAGLFSTATDLYRLFQMMLDEGSFRGKQYVSAETFRIFNTRHYAEKGNRRALGFDKPFINGKSTHVAPQATQSSFGHTGFTGTMVWVDPEYGLIYIFLSNRVHPTSTPNKLAQMNIRTDIQELIYKSLGVKM